MRILVIVIFIAFAHSGMMCKKESGDDNSPRVCGVKNPLSNILWLKKKVDSLKAEGLSGNVRSYSHGGEDIISVQAMIQSCYPCTLYDCSGNALVYARDSVVINAVMNNLDELKVVGEF